MRTQLDIVKTYIKHFPHYFSEGIVIDIIPEDYIYEIAACLNDLEMKAGKSLKYYDMDYLELRDLDLSEHVNKFYKLNPIKSKDTQNIFSNKLV